MILRDVLDLVSKEKRKKERVKVVQQFAVGMGVVAAVGVATGILLAPKSGKETREELKKKAVNTNISQEASSIMGLFLLKKCEKKSENNGNIANRLLSIPFDNI